ncbi:MAG: T9SS type A sorting domain-containing protein [Bacteroidia bacterium]
MKFQKLLFLGLFLPAMAWAQAPCTTTNASGCVCKQNGQTDCDLLPDVTVSGWALSNYNGGPTEYPQSGAGVNNGRLRITGSTPNIGYGSFTVGSLDMWVCGSDTFNNYNTALANCNTPKQLIFQKIYHKNGNTMTYSTRYAGTMTYHPTHGHMHVDEWGIFTLRIQDLNEPNPLLWPIVGDGAKLGFCLMDYGTCSGYQGHCRDSLGNILTNTDFPNYNLGGGGYNCSPIEQGISVGHTDIYDESLDGMWIDIPPGTCNGDYYIVIEIDPHNYFLESNENNNWCAVPFTLTQQVPVGQFTPTVTASGPTTLCSGDAVTLTATQGSTYAWSNGDTTQSITVNTAGTFTCMVTSPCGSGTSTPVVVTVSNNTTAPTATGSTVCEGTTATLNVNGTGNYDWYDAAVGGNLVGSGASFTTGSLSTTTDFWVEGVQTTPGQVSNLGPLDGSFGSGSFQQSNTRYLIFDALTDITLKSVSVNAQAAGDRTIELRNLSGTTVLASTTVNLPAGYSRVTLNFNVPTGNGYQLGLSLTSTADLYRNSSGVSFPYSVSNVASITGSSAGSSFYYFFYDWEVQTPDIVCVTPRTQVTANVNPAPIVSFTGLASGYTTIDPSVTLVGTPTGGTFSGPGVTGNSFSPSAAGVGTHSISYAYTDGNGCEATVSMNTTVTQATSALSGIFNSSPAIFPNPHNGFFTLSMDLAGSHAVSVDIVTVTGQVITHESLGRFTGAYSHQFDISKLAKGVYYVEVKVDQQKVRTMMVHQ